MPKLRFSTTYIFLANIRPNCDVISKDGRDGRTPKTGQGKEFVKFRKNMAIFSKI